MLIKDLNNKLKKCLESFEDNENAWMEQVTLNEEDFKSLIKNGTLYFTSNKTLEFLPNEDGENEFIYNYKGISFYKPKRIILTDFELVENFNNTED